MAMNPEFIDDRFDIAVFDCFRLRPRSLVWIATLPVMEREHDSGVRTTTVPIGKSVVQRTTCRNSWNSTGWSDIGKRQPVLRWTRRWGLRQEARGRCWLWQGRVLVGLLARDPSSLSFWLIGSWRGRGGTRTRTRVCGASECNTRDSSAGHF
jgi:hypothetical protein